MARVREFDPLAALESAMMVFWQKGYTETSMDDIVLATGVSRYGLYGEFGSKHELFLACLDHYQATAIKGMFAIVEQPDAGLKEIKQYFTNVLAAYSQSYGKLGCLMCNSATEIAPLNDAVGLKIREAMTRLTFGFSLALSNAKNNGELKASLDAKQTADFLTGVLLGASVMARSGVSHQMLVNTIERSLAAI